jgi:hypothetical protein
MHIRGAALKAITLTCSQSFEHCPSPSTLSLGFLPFQAIVIHPMYLFLEPNRLPWYLHVPLIVVLDLGLSAHHPKSNILNVITYSTEPSNVTAAKRQ